jgi:alpha-galactosidase
MKNTTLLVTSSVLSMGSMAAVFDDLARTPPMGWNSWNLFDKDITEQDVMQMADAMAATGMAEAGYEYIVLDNSWQSGRDNDCQVITDQERFPHGMRSLADYIHAKGLKFGIYADSGQGYPEPAGENDSNLIDAMTYSHWDLDYLKYNWYCPTLNEAPDYYTMMQQALFAVARPVIFNVLGCDTFPTKDRGRNPGHQWASTNSEKNWKTMSTIFDRQSKLVQDSGPGYWNDPGMLDVGNGHMTTEEYRTHFSLWCMLTAPLMTGNDLRSMSPETLSILTNREMIAIDQDTFGNQAFCFRNYGDYEVWIKPLENEEKAVCIFNRSIREISVDVVPSILLKATNNIQSPDPFLLDDYTIRDVWHHEYLGMKGSIMKLTLPAHGVRVLKFERVREEESFEY